MLYGGTGVVTPNEISIFSCVALLQPDGDLLGAGRSREQCRGLSAGRVSSAPRLGYRARVTRAPAPCMLNTVTRGSQPCTVICLPAIALAAFRYHT